MDKILKKELAEKTAPFLLVGVGMVLAAYGLGTRSLWFDECLRIFTAEANTLKMLKTTGFHPPLYYLILKLFIQVLGNGPVAVRLSSLLFYGGALIYTYKLGKYLFDKRLGLYCLALAAFSSLLIPAAQEASMYAQLFFFSMVSNYYFFRALKEGEQKHWLLYASSTLLVLYTQYVSVVTLGTQLIYLLIYYRYYQVQIGKVIISYLLILLGYLPWLPIFWKRLSAGKADWHCAAPRFSALYELRHLLVRFFSLDGLYNFPQVDFLLFYSGFSLIGLTIVWGMWLILHQPDKKHLLTFLLLYVFLTLYIHYKIRMGGVALHPGRRELYLYPFLLFCYCFPVVKLRNQGVKLCLLILPIVLGIVTLSYNYWGKGQEQWKEATRHVEMAWQDNDLLLFNVGYMNICFDYYAKESYPQLGFPRGTLTETLNLHNYHAPRWLADIEAFWQRNQVALNKARRIWLVLSHNHYCENYQAKEDTLLTEYLLQHPQYRLVKKGNYNRIIIYLFEKKDDHSGKPIS